MDTRKTIRKILFITLWVAIGSGMITLLAAAMRNQRSEKCSDLAINIRADKQNRFVDENDVRKIITKGNTGKIKGQARSSFDLMALEQLLEKNLWVKDAELYFDNKNVLQVTVTTREPVARIFTLAGNSFYIDTAGTQLPLSDKISADVPVFTGFPVKRVVSKRDKALLQDLVHIASFIQRNEFWRSQVSQIDITPSRELEMIPVVGNHLVKLGAADNIESKFNRLFLFYQKILSKTGFDRYRAIDVQFTGQVIGVKGYNSKVDSVQLRRNVERLLKLSREVQYDSIAPVIARPAEEASVVPANMAQTNVNPNPVKSSVERPKAVMPKRND